MQIDAFNEILVLVSSWFKQFVDEKQFVEITQVRQKTKPDSKHCFFSEQRHLSLFHFKSWYMISFLVPVFLNRRLARVQVVHEGLDADPRPMPAENVGAENEAPWRQEMGPILGGIKFDANQW